MYGAHDLYHSSYRFAGYLRLQRICYFFLWQPHQNYKHLSKLVAFTTAVLLAQRLPIGAFRVSDILKRRSVMEPWLLEEEFESLFSVYLYIPSLLSRKIGDALGDKLGNGIMSFSAFVGGFGCAFGLGHWLASRNRSQQKSNWFPRVV